MFPLFGGQLSLQLGYSDALLRIDLPLIVYFFLFLSPSLIPCIAIKQFLAFLRSIQEVFHLQCNSLSCSIDSCGTFDRGCSGRGWEQSHELWIVPSMGAWLARWDQVGCAGSHELVVFGLNSDLVMALVASFGWGPWAYGFALRWEPHMTSFHCQGLIGGCLGSSAKGWPSKEFLAWVSIEVSLRLRAALGSIWSSWLGSFLY